MNAKLQEALWRASSVISIDSRSPGGDAHHLMLGVKFTETRFLVHGMGWAGTVVVSIVGDENRFELRDAIVRGNRDRFEWQNSSSFCSLTAQEVLQLAQMSISRMPDKRPYRLFANNKAETKKTFDRLCQLLQLKPLRLIDYLLLRQFWGW